MSRQRDRSTAGDPGIRKGTSSAPPRPADPEGQASEIAEPATAYQAGAALPAAVAQKVLERLGELEARYGEQGRSLADLGSADDLAERMVATVPAPSPWGELGPFYSTTRVARLLGGVSRQAIADRRRRGTILGLRTADGDWVYPDFQFDDHQTVLEGLPGIWKLLRATGVDEWTLASWLTSPMRSLGDRSPIDWLRRGEDRATLVALARDAAHRFSR